MTEGKKGPQKYPVNICTRKALEMLVLKKGVVACFLKEWPVWRFSKKKSRLHSTDFLDWVVRLHLDDDDSSVCPCHDRKKRFGRRPPRSSPNHPKSSYAAAFDEFVSCDVKAISISQASNSCVIKNTKHLQAFPLGMKSSSRQFFSLSLDSTIFQGFRCILISQQVFLNTKQTFPVYLVGVYVIRLSYTGQ